MDRVEREIKAVLCRIYPATREVICFVDILHGGMLITTESEMWFFRTSEGWLTGLYRAPYTKDIRRLSRCIETYFRQAAVYLEIRKWLVNNFPWSEQSAAQGKERTGIQFGWN